MTETPTPTTGDLTSAVAMLAEFVSAFPDLPAPAIVLHADSELGVALQLSRGCDVEAWRQALGIHPSQMRLSLHTNVAWVESTVQVGSVRVQLAGDVPVPALLAEVSPGHTRPEDWVCLNLSARMGGRMGPVLRRLLDAEAEVERLRAEASLVAEYRVPMRDAKGWLSVRREPGGDRWAIFSSVRSANGCRRAWAAGRWQTLPVYGESGPWEFTSAEAAICQATALVEQSAPTAGGEPA